MIEVDLASWLTGMVTMAVGYVVGYMTGKFEDKGDK